MERWILDGNTPARRVFVMAHGAGAPMDAPFMNEVAGAIAGRDLAVVRFEFPYMATRRREGSRRPPDRMPALEAAYLEVLDGLRARGVLNPRTRRPQLSIGGKSMGGRVASHLADAVGADALVCLGYPFHPPGKPDRRRTAHLEDLQTPTLIVQGTRDPFGRPDEVESYALSPRIAVHWIEDGDHSFKPRMSSGRTEADTRVDAAGAIRRFLDALA